MITRQKIKARIYEMVGRVLAEDLENKIDRALKSGAIDQLQYGDDYQLPKIILTAILEELAEGHRPLTNEGQAEVENLRLFL